MIPSEGEVSEGEHGSPADEEMLGGTELETAPGRVRDMRVLSLPEPARWNVELVLMPSHTLMSGFRRPPQNTWIDTSAQPGVEQVHSMQHIVLCT